ncbi:MAG: hypothetical protein Kow0092_10800 [Deferrisomatales bacterium]
MVLFTQHWDVAPGKQNAYSDFVMAHYNPTLERVGIRLVGGYYVAIGAGPRIIAVGVTQDLGELHAALEREEYQEATDGLMEHVTHYESRILVPTGRVRAERYELQTGIWKLTQYWNVIPGMEKEYSEFVRDDHLPTMEKLGIRMTGGWRVVVGCGPNIVAEGSAPSLVAIAKAIDTDEYRRITRTLKTTYVTDYSSRVLAPTGRIDIPYFLQGMTGAL